MEEKPQELPIPKAQDGGYGWVIVFASFMVSLIGDGVIYTFGLFIIEIMDDFQASKSSVAWIASVMTGITYCSGPLAGTLVNKYGCRVVSSAGSFLAALGFGISYFAQSVTFLYFSIGVLAGTGLGLIYLPQVVIVTYYFEERRALATGIAVCGSGVGTFIFAPLIEYLIRVFNWRGAMLGMAVILLMCVFFSLLYRPPPTASVERDIGRDVIYGLTKPDKMNNPSVPQEVESDEDEKKDTITNFCSKFDKTASVDPSTIRIVRGAGTGLRIAGSHSLLSSVGRGSKDSLQRICATIPEQRRLSLGIGAHYFHPRTGSVIPNGVILGRKDIFCTGSVANLTHSGKEQRITRISHEMVDNIQRSEGCINIPCSDDFCRTFKTLVDVNILKDPFFLLFVISNFCTSIGYNSPYIYIVDMAIGDPGNPANDKVTAGYLLSIIGLTNTVSRVFFGYISDKPWVNRLYLYNVSLIIAGIATCFCSYTTDFFLLSIYSAIYGITMGVYITLTSVILVDLLGLERLTNAFGLLLLIIGMATVFGPPLIGFLVDEFGDYVYGFWLTGSTIAISGCIMFPIPYLARREYAKQIKNMDDASNGNIPSSV